LLKNRKILQEYDFILKKTLSRKEAKSREILSKTFNEFKKYLDDTKHITEINLNSLNFLNKLKNIILKRNIFLISDTHFDHTNIIKYCNRPFKSTSEMNKIMLNNWNKTINNRDIVFFLGDMRCGRNSRSTDFWLKRLNGKIYFLNNTHDTKSRITKYYDKLIIHYKDKKFLLVHDPKDIPKDWNEWTICGHHHNNYPNKFPLINGKTKMINVGVELINYMPLSIEKLFELDFENIEYMENIIKVPIRKK
jgi:calcineurin-like phosphoesterase family protein